jgi:hypothetical protein
MARREEEFVAVKKCDPPRLSSVLVDEVLISLDLARGPARPVCNLDQPLVDVWLQDRLPIVFRPVLIKIELFDSHQPVKLDPLA